MLNTRLSLGIVTAGAVVGALFTPAASAFAVAPAISASPNSSLYNTEVVTVSASNLTPSSTASIVECQVADATANGPAAGCDLADAQLSVPVGADGSIADTPLTIKAGQLGSDVDSLCDFSTNGACAIVVADATTQAPYGIAGIAFSAVSAAPNTGLKNGDTTQVSGQGLPNSTAVSLIQCNEAHTDASGSGCNLGGLTSGGSTDATGHLAATAFAVKSGLLGGDSKSICDQATNGQCVIAVIDSTTFAIYGFAPIAFDASTNPPAAKATAVTAKASKTTVKPGKAFTIGGKVTVATKGVNKLHAVLYRRASSSKSWSKVATKVTATVNAVKGVYKFSLKGLKHSEQYQVRHPKETVGGVVFKSSTSKTITIHKG